jgi:hypothetical protein
MSGSLELSLSSKCYVILCSPVLPVIPFDLVTVIQDCWKRVRYLTYCESFRTQFAVQCSVTHEVLVPRRPNKTLKVSEVPALTAVESE